MTSHIMLHTKVFTWVEYKNKLNAYFIAVMIYFIPKHEEKIPDIFLFGQQQTFEVGCVG